ncbi:MAG: hypothetical protein ACE5HI_09765 [bacterium]
MFTSNAAAHWQQGDRAPNVIDQNELEKKLKTNPEKLRPAVQ